MTSQKQKKPIIHINPPPRSGRCQCCGKHIDELKPFGGKGDPLVGDFTGAKIIKNYRAMSNKDSDKIWDTKNMWVKEKNLTKKEKEEYDALYEKQRVPELNYKKEVMKNCYKVKFDLLSEIEKKRFRELEKKYYDSFKHLDEKKFIKKYGKKELENYYFKDQLENTVEASWECRDCVCLDGEDFYKKRSEGYYKPEDGDDKK